MAAEMIDITLDGKQLQVQAGKTILQCAEEQGLRIPTLCNDRRLDPYASCWVCIVKVEKARGFVPSCGTRVAKGMVISTNAPDVVAARKTALELILSNHYGDCKAPCTLTCPSNIDIQGYLGLVANGKDREAVELIRRDNPMPAVIGRICPRPCEEKCRRRLVEEPLNINGIKRFVADAEAQAGGMKPRARPAPTGKRVAVVGAGPAGLAAAWYLSEKGVAVTLYESMEKAGGMLRYGIPDYRLPPAVLDRAISEMLSLGAELRTGVALGKDVTLEGLRAEHDAVVLAFGAWKGRTLRIPGEDSPQVLSGIDFLRDVNRGLPVKVGEIVAILGGGNTALDAARCALRRGAGKVTMYYRRTREEMPASEAEIEEALEEGIDIQYLAAPVSLFSENGQLKTLTLLRMGLGEPDASGRRRPVPIEGSEFTVPVDNVISAVGQFSDTKLVSGLAGFVDERGNLNADTLTGITPVPGVFAAGDLLTGTDIAIRAIAGGKHAARAVMAYLDGRTYQRPREFLSKKSDFREPAPADFKDTARAARARPKVLAAEPRRKGFAEIESTLSLADARAEAERCLECGCQDVKDCALKLHATEYGAEARRFLGETTVHPIDDSHPFISRDPSKCVLCGRCIRICLEVQGIGVFGYMHRGFASVVAPAFGRAFGDDTSCISCGQCVSACPVGALTEKLPARKTVPLTETVVDGACTLCSVGCGIQYRWHGTLFTRVTERNDAPNFGKLCKKGRFGYAFLNEPTAPALDLGEARGRVQKLLAAARSPVMRLSPVLAGEAIDAFIEAAKRRSIPVVAHGLEGVDPRWMTLAGVAKPAAGRAVGAVGTGKTLVLIVGDVESSNNVAFTEAWRRAREGAAELWIAAHRSIAAERAAARLFPNVDAALAEARAVAGGKSGAVAGAGARAVEIWVNPQETAAALEPLLSAAAGSWADVRLLWNARNAGYLFGLVAGSSAGRPGATGPGEAPSKPDLVLDIGVVAAGAGPHRVSWGFAVTGCDICVPLSRDLWTHGRSHPTGMPAVTSGAVDQAALAAAAALI